MREEKRDDTLIEGLGQSLTELVQLLQGKEKGGQRTIKLETKNQKSGE